FLNKSGNTLDHPDLIPFEEMNRKIWKLNAEIFAPCAASRLVTQSQVEELIDGGLEMISSGANVPFADKEIFFGPIMEHIDGRVSVIPALRADCGMARVCAYVRERRVEMTDDAISGDTSLTIKNAIQKTFDKSRSKTNISTTAFEIALNPLV